MAIITLAEVKVFLQISGTSKDALITALTPEIEGFIKEYCNDDFMSSDAVPVEEWPAGIKLPAAQMIGHSMAEMSGGGASIGLTSEDQGEYSYTRGETTGSYPPGILAKLNQWRKVRTHFGSYMQQPRDFRGLTTEDIAEGESREGADGIPLTTRYYNGVPIAN